MDANININKLIENAIWTLGHRFVPHERWEGERLRSVLLNETMRKIGWRMIIGAENSSRSLSNEMFRTGLLRCKKGTPIPQHHSMTNTILTGVATRTIEHALERFRIANNILEIPAQLRKGYWSTTLQQWREMAHM
jgi:hypothetical protein